MQAVTFVYLLQSIPERERLRGHDVLGRYGSSELEAMTEAFVLGALDGAGRRYPFPSRPCNSRTTKPWASPYPPVAHK